MKGMFASVSIVLAQEDLLLTINHASGKPAARSKRETLMAIVKEADIAETLRRSRSGYAMISKILDYPKRTPKTGGTNTMIRKNRMPNA